MAKLVWRVTLIAELEPGIASETEVARIERDDLTVPDTLGLTLKERKQLLAPAQEAWAPQFLFVVESCPNVFVANAGSRCSIRVGIDRYLRRAD